MKLQKTEDKKKKKTREEKQVTLKRFSAQITEYFFNSNTEKERKKKNIATLAGLRQWECLFKSLRQNIPNLGYSILS